LKAGAHTPAFALPLLLAQTELFNNGTVALNVVFGQVVEQVAAATYHLEQTAAGMMILFVHLQMLGELVDAHGQNRNLNLGGTGIAFVGFAQVNGLLFCFFRIILLHLILILNR
jgi:hypothetical protein